MCEVGVVDMMRAREKRSELQAELIKKFGFPVVCLSLNIAGSIKTGDKYLYLFNSLLTKIRAVFDGIGAEILFERLIFEKTGYEAVFCVKALASELKQVFIGFEDTERLGRLADIDVIDVDFNKLSRGKIRPCLVCKRSDLACVSRRRHDLNEIIQKTDFLILNDIKLSLAEKISALAQKALLYELSISPKPGLVDRLNNGSHRDMDFYSFIDSSVALRDYFDKLVLLALDKTDENCTDDKEKSSLEQFNEIKALALSAQNDMFFATGGKNTHKGAIFHLGLAVFACAKTMSVEAEKISEYIKASFSKIIENELEQRLLGYAPLSSGEKIYKEYAVMGARAEAMSGYRLVLDELLPALKKKLSKGYDYAGACCLLSAILNSSDSTAIKRAGLDGFRSFRDKIRAVLEPDFNDLVELDRQSIELNISFGGAADLLSLSLFLMFLESDTNIKGLFDTIQKFD